MIGLGTSYNYDNFGAQFCLPHNAANPILPVRYRESTSWGGWQNITAGCSTSGDKTISGALTTTGNIDCGGGIALNGSNAFSFAADVVDTANKTNTYKNFKDAGASSAWCCLRF
jgi:hypothetical protein